MEGIFQEPKFITLATKVAIQKNIPFKVYELKCSLKTLQIRDKNRPGVKEGCRRPLGNKTITYLDSIIKKKPWVGSIKLDTEKLSLVECFNILRQEFRYLKAKFA